MTVRALQRLLRKEPRLFGLTTSGCLLVGATARSGGWPLRRASCWLKLCDAVYAAGITHRYVVKCLFGFDGAFAVGGLGRP